MGIDYYYKSMIDNEDIVLSVYEYDGTNKEEIWNKFKNHHYLTQEFNKGAKIYLLYWNDTLVGFNSFLNMPSGTSKFFFRTHRMVILPDYQGLGIGMKFEEFMGEWFLKQNKKMFLRTTHLRFGRHCSNSPLWKASATNQVQRVGVNENNSVTTQGKKYKAIDDTRIAYSFEYVGKDYSTKEHQIIVCDGECDKTKAEEILDKIIDIEKFPIIVSGIADQSVITVWEQIAIERNIRTEILYIKRKDTFNINHKYVDNDFDCIVTDDKSKESVKDYLKHCNKCFTYYEDGTEFYSDNYKGEYYDN